MKLKWEKNRISVSLANQGKIKGEDIVPKTSTADFPTEAATVRMKNLSHKHPYVTLHIRGAAVQRQYYGGNTFSYAPTMRVNLGGDYYTGRMMSGVSGELDDTQTFEEVHEAVTKVKELMGF